MRETMLTPVPSAPLSSVAYTMFMVKVRYGLWQVKKWICVSHSRYWFLLRNNMDLPILSRRSSQTHKETVLFMSAVNDCSFPWRCRVFAGAVARHPDAVAVVSQMTRVYEEAGVMFEFPAFPAVPEEAPVIRLQEGTFSSTAHYGGSMMIRKSACQWGRSLPMTDNFEDDLMGFHVWLQGSIYELPDVSLYYYRFAVKTFVPSTVQRGLPA